MATYREATNDDFGENKSNLKFYESDDGKTVKEPPTLVTDPNKENMAKYVVEVASEDESAVASEDESAVASEDESAVASEGQGKDTNQGEAAAADADKGEAADADKGEAAGSGPSEQDKTFTLSVIQQSLAMDGLKEKKTPEQIKEIIKELFPSISPGDLNKMAADVQNGARRRTKRKDRKGSRKSRKGAKKGAKKSRKGAKKSQNGGRRRSSKNRRKQSRRRKH